MKPVPITAPHRRFIKTLDRVSEPFRNDAAMVPTGTTIVAADGEPSPAFISVPHAFEYYQDHPAQWKDDLLTLLALREKCTQQLDRANTEAITTGLDQSSVNAMRLAFDVSDVDRVIALHKKMKRPAPVKGEVPQ